MRAGVHQTVLADALQAADSIVFYSPPDLAWQPRVALAALGTRAQFPTSVDAVLAALLALCQPGDHVLVMSNGSFDGVHQRLLSALLAGSAGLAAVN
ncbi:MAG: hypothetical protein B7Y53_01815 [Halothiobacillus sp. 28-55-5]|nr:MAG: hypothetical protein B7Y53_01815 [Halothiobacillus sp. 28-55-5]